MSKTIKIVRDYNVDATIRKLGIVPNLCDSTRIFAYSTINKKSDFVPSA